MILHCILISCHIHSTHRFFQIMLMIRHPNVEKVILGKRTLHCWRCYLLMFVSVWAIPKTYVITDDYNRDCNQDLNHDSILSSVSKSSPTDSQFDSQPRSIPITIPVKIPSRSQSRFQSQFQSRF